MIMATFAKLMVPIAIFLLASYANAFIILSSAAGKQVLINHLIRLEGPMSKQTNETTNEPTHKPSFKITNELSIDLWQSQM